MTILAVSLGCPAGIGPAVAVGAAARLQRTRCVLVGDPLVIRSAARRRRVAQRRLVPVADRAAIDALSAGQIGLWEAASPLRERVTPGKPTPAAGLAQLAWIDEACDLVHHGVADALVTGPVSKAIISSAEGAAAKRFRGHTEHLARRLGASHPVMIFWSKRLTTALVTTHLPVAKVATAITPPRVAAACCALGELLSRLGHERPRIAVAALNPHAGDDGLFGDEEHRVIKPGITSARRRLRRAAKLTGPVGAETAFRMAVDGAYDGVVAMYHDQATIPSKLMAFGDAVNVTWGLPLIRTSVDHGTAYDVAGTRGASDSGMLAALALAARLTS